MSVLWLIVGLVILMFAFQGLELALGKRPRKLILKEQVNSNVTFFGIVATWILLLILICAVGALSQVVEYKVYLGYEPFTIGCIMIAAKLFPVVLFFFVLILCVKWVRLSTKSVYNWNIWKYTPEELEYTKNQKTLLKEKNRKRFNPKVFKFFYPEKKPKKAPKYPRLYKFIFGEEKKDS